MLISLYGLVASLFNRDAKALIRALIMLIITAGVYSFMYYEAITTECDSSVYYSVNNWAENLVILVTIIESLGAVLWGYTIYNALRKK